MLKHFIYIFWFYNTTSNCPVPLPLILNRCINNECYISITKLFEIKLPTAKNTM